MVRGLYLGGTEETAWAEWYRYTSEQGAPPASRMPRDTWRIAVDVTDIGDLSGMATLGFHGVTELTLQRRSTLDGRGVATSYRGFAVRA